VPLRSTTSAAEGTLWPTPVTRPTTVIFPLLIGLLACKHPVEAPTEMDELTRYLLREFEAEDPAGLMVGLDNLRPLLAEAPDEGWSLTAPNLEDLGDLQPPEGLDPGDAQGLAVVYDSPHPVADHVALMLLEDLTPVSPTAETYARSFTEGQDCFEDGGCEFLRTVNEIYRSNLLMSMGFTLYEDYRWVGDAVLSRNWIAESAHGDEASNHLWQDWEIEVWLPTDEGGTLRLWAMWTQAEYAGISEEMAEVSGRAGLVSAMETQDELIAGGR